MRSLNRAIPLHFVKITCVALDWIHVVKSNLFLCLIKHRVLKPRKLVQLYVHTELAPKLHQVEGADATQSTLPAAIIPQSGDPQPAPTVKTLRKYKTSNLLMDVQSICTSDLIRC